MASQGRAFHNLGAATALHQQETCYDGNRTKRRDSSEDLRGCEGSYEGKARSLQTARTQTVLGFMGHSQQFELGLKLHWKPVTLFLHGRYKLSVKWSRSAIWLLHFGQAEQSSKAALCGACYSSPVIVVV